MKPVIGRGAAVVAALMLAGCGSVKVRQIVSNPAKYHNREVSVEGTVKRAYGIPFGGYYQVEDDTGRIHVIANGPVPPAGSSVRVKGTVTSGLMVMGQGFGTTLRERDHRVR